MLRRKRTQSTEVYDHHHHHKNNNNRIRRLHGILHQEKGSISKMALTLVMKETQHNTTLKRMQPAPPVVGVGVGGVALAVVIVIGTLHHHKINLGEKRSMMNLKH